MMFIFCLIMLFFVGVHMLHFIKFSIQAAIIFSSSCCYPETPVIQKVNSSGFAPQGRHVEETSLRPL